MVDSAGGVQTHVVCCSPGWQTWAVVCEITYLDPQYRRKGETSIAFATRVKELIADAAGLKPVPWDGLLKYRTPRVSNEPFPASVPMPQPRPLACVRSLIGILTVFGAPLR